MKSFGKAVAGFFLFIYGLFAYKLLGKMPRLGHTGFRSFFVTTNGRVNDFFSDLIGWFRKPYEQIDYTTDLKQLTDKDLDTVVAEINKNGYFRFEKYLSDSLIDPIIHLAKTEKTRHLLPGSASIAYSTEKGPTDFDRPKSPRYQFDSEDLMKCRQVNQLVFNKGLLAVSNQYLGARPKFDFVTMWWSFPFDKKEKSNAAQMYHFDLPRFKWIKFFVYLTDVHEDNGPHCFIQGSHKSLPKSVKKVGRLSDEDVQKAFSAEDLLEIKGKKGSLIAVDTRGLHKGKPLTRDSRLILQIEYTNSFFGTAPVKIKNAHPEMLAQMEKEGFGSTYSLLN